MMLGGRTLVGGNPRSEFVEAVRDQTECSWV